MVSATRRIAALSLISLIILSPGFSEAGWWNKNSNSPKKFSRSWWNWRAQDPPGTRQKHYAGKAWPVMPRPMGKEPLLIHNFHAAQYWPLPYVHEDRCYVRNLSQIQTDNGWVMETTLYDYHFDRDTHRLNRSGQLQLRWILESAPARYRTAFVQKTNNAETSQMRLTNVQNEAAAMVGAGHMPPIMLRITSPLGRPAIEVDMIRRLELETIPDPRIVDPIESGSAVPGDAGG